MKQSTKLTLALTIIASSCFAQSGVKWATGGNSTSATDFLGTTNNAPLIFKANNLQTGMFDVNGNLSLTSLKDGTKGLVFYDADGQLNRLPYSNNSNQVLFSNGTWGNLPNANNLWHTNGNSINYNGGYVGIGTSTPLFPLDVIGDARVSNNLYVGGGVIITDKVRATGDVKTGRLEADTIKMDGGRVIVGETKIEGDVKARFKLDVLGEARFGELAYFDRTITANNDLNVGGATHLANGFTFDGTTGIKYIPSNGSNPGIINLGGNPQASIANVTSNCAASWGNLGTQAPNWFQVYQADASNNYIPNGSILNFQTWTGGSSIDATTATPNTGGLLLNYWCGNNTYINTGVNGGIVSMGKRVEIGMPNASSNTNLNIKSQNFWKAISIKNQTNTETFSVFDDGSVYISQAANIGSANWGLTVLSPGTQNQRIGVGVQIAGSLQDAQALVLNLNNKNQFAISVNSADYPAGEGTRFVVKGSGATYIGFKKPTGNHADALLSVDGKGLFKSIYVSTSSAVWADYVFEKNYELLSLEKVEAYYKENKHLPGVPSAKEFEAQGINVAENQAMLMKKIEELTIYLVELEKKVKNMENNK